MVAPKMAPCCETITCTKLPKRDELLLRVGSALPKASRRKTASGSLSTIMAACGRAMQPPDAEAEQFAGPKPRAGDTSGRGRGTWC